MRQLFVLILFFAIPFVGSCGEPPAEKATGCVIERSIALADGAATPELVLQNKLLRVAILPALGGKIASMQDKNGREYISRSDRAYTVRKNDMKFGDSEFDGIDELFPTLGECQYPGEPWVGKLVAAHGELFRQSWKRIEGDGVILETKGINFPYVFRRQAVLDGATLVLNYSVTNESDAPFHYLYTFHPLLKGETGCRLDLSPATKVFASWSTKGWMGTVGSELVLGDIRDADGKRFLDNMFSEQTGRYWKFFTERLPEGRVAVRYADGTAIRLEWPVKMMPYLAVWCSEGSTGGLHHIAPEPVVSRIEALDKAEAAGETYVLPPKGGHTWTIRLTVLPVNEGNAIK